MRLALVGAGSVGLELGALLARAGYDLLFVVRREEAARALRQHGVRVVDPTAGTSWQVDVDALAGFDAAAPRIADRVVLLCTRTPDNEVLASALARAAPRATVVAAQNDVDGDAVLARHFPRVIGLVVRHAVTRVADNRVTSLGSGRVVLGLHEPSEPAAGPDDRGALETLATALRGTGLDVAVSPRIQEDRWLKLCVNLMSTVNALVVRGDHRSAAFVESKAALLEEARLVLGAAGVRARSCDGRDRSLEEEIAYQRESRARGTSARSAPIYNAVWTALRSGAPLEADLYHGRIIALGRDHGVPTPANQRVLALLAQANRDHLGPEWVRAEALRV